MISLLSSIKPLKLKAVFISCVICVSFGCFLKSGNDKKENMPFFGNSSLIRFKQLVASPPKPLNESKNK